jgi:hypothetical protein
MATHKYKVASEEGAQRYGAEVGQTVELDIKDEELAVIAAGWLEHATTKPAKEDK